MFDEEECQLGADSAEPGIAAVVKALYETVSLPAGEEHAAGIAYLRGLYQKPS